ncbi:GFA family protein [Rhizobium sp. ZW T2_16]|jgi:hypothetical protein|uniref:GFA family protein n=1 Tax=Rhizobium sp. ZW T2_16 TaxID=3378083 RepID=UPI003852A00B
MFLCRSRSEASCSRRSTVRHTGGCRCGAIKFEAKSEPFYSGYYHCDDCRRASGAPVAAFVGFFCKDIIFSGLEGSSYGKDPIQRTFCPTCGSPIAYCDGRIDDQIFFMIGAMDHPEQYPPLAHGYARIAVAVSTYGRWPSSNDRQHSPSPTRLTTLCETRQ